MMSASKDLTGQRFGRLTVLERNGSDRRKNAVWLAVCDCGKKRFITTVALHSDGIRSCGCLRRETTIALRTKHGYAANGVSRAIWDAFSNARARCRNERRKDWSYYGGRGIEFRFSSLQQFAEEIGERPGRAYSIDRIDCNGHYEPGNVRWATKRVQSLNRRDRERQDNSPFKGVYPNHNRWVASIQSDGRQLYLGIFETPEEAAKTYDKFARVLHGKFAKLNFPQT